MQNHIFFNDNPIVEQTRGISLCLAILQFLILAQIQQIMFWAHPPGKQNTSNQLCSQN